MTVTPLSTSLARERLDIPDGPWMADQWHMRRPDRDATSGSTVCLVDGCPHPAGTPEGEVRKEVHALCLAHRRRRRKEGVSLPFEQFVRAQASASPILGPRGARTRKEHYPVIDFARVHPHFADELRWITAAKIRRNQWRGDEYVNRLLRQLIEVGERNNYTNLVELAAPVGMEDEHGKPILNRNISLAMPSMLQMLRYARHDRWSSLYWHPRDHGISPDVSSVQGPVNWEPVTCDWLREALMSLSADYLKSGARSWGTIGSYVRAGSLLSQYMGEVRAAQPSELTRPYFLDFVAWVRDANTARGDLNGVNMLARLLFTLRDSGYVPELASSVYLLRGENPVRKQRKPKPFPDDILSRIDDLLTDPTSMDDDVRLLLRIFRAVSPRASEALSLPVDCVQHGPRGYTLEHFQDKVQSWRRVPLPPALGEDLAKQAETVRRLYPENKFLFPYLGSSPRVNTLAQKSNVLGPWPYGRFTDTVWAIYQEHGITASSVTGEVLTGAQLHRFRHSIATGLLTEGWSQYEVQKFLGHSSPTMMQAYAEIHEDTLRTKYEEFVKHSVDISGQHQHVDTATMGDVERLRDRMVRSALPNGYCTLPETASCDFVPSPCLTCKPFFRTTPTFLPIHIRQRDESMRQLDVAREAGHERAIEAHTRTVEALEAIIEGLQGEASDAEDVS